MGALGLALAALIGLSLGLLGGGGSILTVPILVYVLGFEAKEAIAASLVVVGATSLFGALGHWRAGRVRPRTALAFGLVAMLGAFAGARLAGLLSGTLQLAVFAVVMLAAAVSIFRGRAEGDESAPPRPLPLIVLAGLAVGVLTGVVGVGGGFLIVPALVLLARLPMKQAVGTSLVVIAMNSAAGFTGYLGRVPIRWGFLLAFTAVAIGASCTVLYRAFKSSPKEGMFVLLIPGYGFYYAATHFRAVGKPFITCLITAIIGATLIVLAGMSNEGKL